ncbi:sensor histidine kinase [Cohnella sp. LGH]|uniref:cache domain-containing sensor histidine kinase n=1 Tax=Cohnella sp. LGH TaxID=1619153 RepID=UPI001ADC3481|nr:sensor histidine kinase [Cohnella sp. LGH]QTH45377.1 sensor histidine kinase [Cohnella sp. LGH]
MPLFIRLLLSFLIAILIPSLFIGLFSYWRVSAAIESEVSSSVNTTIRQVNLNLQTHIRQVVELSTAVYIHPTVQRLMGRQSPIDGTELPEEVRNLQSLLSSVTNYQKLYKVRLYYRFDELVPPGFEIPELRPIGALEALPDFAAAAAARNGMNWSAGQAIPSGAAHELTLFRVLKGMSDERELGAIAVSMPERNIWDILKDVKIGRTGFLFIADSTGHVVSHHNPSLIGSDLSGKPYFKRVLESAQGNFRISIDGSPYLFVHQTIEGTDWKLIGFVHTKELTSRIESIRVAAITAALVGFGLAIAYSAYTSGWFAKRIGNLIKAMRRIEGGDLGTQLRLDERRKDEISQLYVHFNRMSAELKEYVETIGRTNARMRSAELKALQHQINPHFLYNTLDAINWMAATRYKATDISAMVTALARLFRLSLNKDNELTTIGHEIEHVRCYVAIQKIRFDNDFDLEIDIDPGLESETILKLILQPLVENAILHGFKDLSVPGKIVVCARRKGHAIELAVMDNGRGCDAAFLNGMLATDAASPTEDETEEKSPALRIMGSGSGYGLRNVNERIRLYYGESYGIRFESAGQTVGGTTVRVTLATLTPGQTAV